MSNIDKIKAEIEKRREECNKSNYYLDNSEQALGYECALDDLLSFIESLEKGQPNGLEVAAREYANIKEDGDKEKYVNGYLYNGFFAGAEWQRERILKDAVDGIARPDDCEIWVNLKGYDYNYKDGDKIKLIIIKES